MDWFIWALAAGMVLITLIPMLRTPHGAIRSFSFARQQLIVIAVILVPVAALSGNGMVAIVIAATGLFQALYIARFFATGRVQSLPADMALLQQQDRHIRILTANIRLSNRDHDRLIALIRAENPDLVVLLETDALWVRALAPLHDIFPHRAERPLDNGYGMAVLSNRPLEDVTWRDLLLPDVPSLRAVLRLDGEAIRLHVLHPEPPVPLHDTKGRDAEIGLIGIEVGEDPLPAIVTGDLNDVAWSHTTRRFQRLSGQLDPRVGRGFYNTFHAHIPLCRWPLDHLFHDARFRLVEMRRLPDIGSDHFPMLFHLALAPTEAAGEKPDASRQSDREEVIDMAQEERARDRDAIGEDWEKSPKG